MCIFMCIYAHKTTPLHLFLWCKNSPTSPSWIVDANQANNLFSRAVETLREIQVREYRAQMQFERQSGNMKLFERAFESIFNCTRNTFRLANQRGEYNCDLCDYFKVR